MRVTVNGAPRELADRSTVAMLVAGLGFEAAQVAVERNREVVPRRLHNEVILAEGDELEVVTFVGGG